MASDETSPYTQVVHLGPDSSPRDQGFGASTPGEITVTPTALIEHVTSLKHKGHVFRILVPRGQWEYVADRLGAAIRDLLSSRK